MRARRTFLLALLLTLALGCERAYLPTPQPEDRRGGRGRGNTGGTTGTSSDSLLNACGIRIDSSGTYLPTVQLTNLRSYHVTRYSTDPVTGAPYPYDVLVVTCDPVSIPGQTVNCYTLLADQCQARPVCNPYNGVALSQVTSCNPSSTFYLPVGTTWLDVTAPQYTGYLMIGTTTGCLYLSQPFTFEPPRILQL